MFENWPDIWLQTTQISEHEHFLLLEAQKVIP